MALENTPETGESGIWNEDGSTTVPKGIREKLGIGKGDELKWVSDAGEDHVRVFKID